jgi:phage protein D
MPPPDALRSARPVVLVDGEERPQLAGGLLRMRLAESPDGLYQGELAFSNWGPRQGETGYLYFDGTLDFGQRLQVKLDGDSLFDGRISAIEGRYAPASPPEIVVLAEDRLQDLRMTRRTRVFEDQSDADILRRIASDHGLTADVDVAGPTHAAVAQLNETDLGFLRARARLSGWELWVEDRTLKARPRSARRTGPLGFDLGGALRRFRVTADLAGQASRAQVGGWDRASKQALTGSDDGGALAGEVGNGRSGFAVLGEKLGQRVEKVAHLQPVNAGEADALARAWFAQMARRFVRGHGECETRAGLHVGARVGLHGLGPLFEGDYDVVGVEHLFDATNGLRSLVEVERAWVGRGA